MPASWQATVVNESGNIQKEAQVTVRIESTGAIAPLWSDRDGTVALSNPFNADDEGFARFYAAGNAYRIDATLGGFTRTWRHVSIGTLGELDELPSTLVKYDITSAETATGVTPTNYFREPYESRRYNALADDSTNDYTALQNMLDSAKTASSSGTNAVVARLHSETNKFRVDSGLSFDAQYLTFDGQGNTLNFTNKTSGAFSGVKLTASSENLNRQVMRHTVRGLRNVTIEMPSYTVNAVGVGVELVDETDDGSGNFRGGLMHLENVSVLGGAYALKFGNGAWGSTIVNFSAGHDAGNTGGVGVYAPSPWTDGAEAPVFLGGFMASRTRAFWLELGGCIVSGMKIDGCPIIGKLDGLGVLKFVGGYSEFTEADNVQYKFDASDSNAVIEISDWEFNVRADLLASRTVPFINCAGAVILRNVLFRSTNIAWYKANGGFLVTGAGAVKASGITYRNFPWAPLVSKSLQWLAYPDIDNANALASFTLSNVGGGDDPVRATAISDGSSTRDAVHFSVNSGGIANDESAAEFLHSVAPGKTLTTVGDIYAPALTSSNVRFEIVITFLDRAGNTISGPSTEIIATTNVANWTAFGATATVPAGAETARVVYRSLATGAVGSDTEVYISPLGAGYSDGDCDVNDPYLKGSATYDPPSLADGVGATTTVTVTGAALGDFAEASFSLDLQGITLTAWVSSANTVSARFQNESGGVLDLASGTLRARVRKAI